MYIARARCESQLAVRSSGLNACWSLGRAVEFKFLAWSSIAQSVCQQAFSLLVNRYLRPWVRILPSAEEDNLSPLDSNIACLCQSIEINNNKHIISYYIFMQLYFVQMARRILCGIKVLNDLIFTCIYTSRRKTRSSTWLRGHWNWYNSNTRCFNPYILKAYGHC